MARSSGRDATHYPLALMVQPGERACALRLDYRPDLFDRTARRRLVGARLVRLLAAAAADAGAAARRRSTFCRAAERDTILRVLERRRRGRCRSATLPELFAAQAAPHAGRGRAGVRRTAR